jgi:hypothetical protein
MARRVAAGTPFQLEAAFSISSPTGWKIRTLPLKPVGLLFL